MKCLQLICAQSVITDKTTNQVSIFNIVEYLTSNLFPFQIPVLALFISLEREEVDPLSVFLSLRILIDEIQLFNHPIQVSFIEGDLRNNTTINLQGLLINKSGTLNFLIEYNNVVLKSYSFSIKSNQ